MNYIVNEKVLERLINTDWITDYRTNKTLSPISRSALEWIEDASQNLKSYWVYCAPSKGLVVSEMEFKTIKHLLNNIDELSE